MGEAAAVTPRSMPSPRDVLDFWFDPASEPFWFEKNDGFGALTETALTGGIDHWADHATADGRGTLALVIVLDQFTRNIYRGDPRCYAGDAAALSHASAAIAAGVETGWPEAQRAFLYMPYQHVEDAKLQERSVELFARLGRDTQWYKSAVEHRDVVARFGRFPHRNAILGRESTPEEARFLTEPGSSF